MAEELLLNELEAKSRILDEYRTRLESLRRENQDLLFQLETKERDSMAVIKYLRQENDTLQEQLRIHKDESEIAKDSAEKTIRTANEDRDGAIAEMEAKYQQADESREAELRKLREELYALKSFKERKEILESELERVHQELFDTQAAHKEAMSGIERKLIEEKTRLQKEAHAQLMEIKRNTDEEVVNRLDVSTKRILQQNRRLAEDLKLHVQETAELQKMKARLEEDNKRLKRDLELNGQQMEEYAKDRFKHTQQIKDLQTKVKNLEKSLSQVVKDFERERERLVSKSKSEMEDTEIENVGLRKLIKIKEREHAKVKKLAQEIVGQRTEVEQFFLEALEQVRDEVLKERMRAKDAPDGTFITTESSTHFQARLPQIQRGPKESKPGPAPAVPEYSPNQKVDIRDLTWEDKERVLRLLFAKINQSQGPGAAAAGPGAGPQAHNQHGTVLV